MGTSSGRQPQATKWVRRTAGALRWAIGHQPASKEVVIPVIHDYLRRFARHALQSPGFFPPPAPTATAEPGRLGARSAWLKSARLAWKAIAESPVPAVGRFLRNNARSVSVIADLAQ